MIPAKTWAASALMVMGAACVAKAQDGVRETDATLDAYAAGYKAAFTCSATFNAGKKRDEIDRDEFFGIYPLIADKVKALPDAIVDGARRRVSVPYREGFPPRISQWRPNVGCVQLPVGATADVADKLPRARVPMPSSTIDLGGPWKRFAPINGSSGNSRLDGVADQAFKKGPYGTAANTSAVLIVSRDAILLERYAPGFTKTTSQRTWSVAKSIASTVIGAAVHDGLIGVDDPAAIPEWGYAHDPRQKITVKNLMHMASGLDSNRAGNRTDRLYMGGGLVTDTATEAALEVTPGSRWKYANNDTLLMVRALAGRFKTQQDWLDYPFKALLYKIGMTHTRPETDWAGDFILSSQVWTTSRDLARLGLLYLNDGVWTDTQGRSSRILPEGWTKFVSTPAPAQPPLAARDGSPRPGYGAQWWLYGEQFPDIPNDTIAARGNRGQYLVVIPSMGLIIVRRGYDPARQQGFQLDRFIADVVKAVS